jgi:hypothetical protein
LGAGVKTTSEASTSVVEHLAHLDAAREEFAASCVNVVHRQHQPVDRARPGRDDPFAEDDRRLRSRRSELYAAKVFIRDVDI